MKATKVLFNPSFRWAIAFAAAIAVFALPLPIEYRLFCSIVAWCICVWAFSLMHYAVVAVLLPVLFVVLGLGDAATVFGGWLSTSVWATLGGILFGRAFMKSGLAKRMALKLTSLTRCDFKGVVLALALACLVITPAIPSVMGKIVLMVPIAIELSDIFGFKKGDTSAAALLLVVYFALWSPKMAFPTASVDAVLASSILIEQYQIDVSWIGWARDMSLPALVWTFISVGLVFVLKPQQPKLEKEKVIERYRSLGALSAEEKKLSVAMAVVVVMLMTENVHGVNPAYVLVFASAACFASPLDLLAPSDFKNADLSIVFFLAGVMSIGAVASKLGITAAVVDGIRTLLTGRSNFFFVMALYLCSVLANFFLNPLATIATLLGPVTELSMHLGYSPMLGAYSMIMGFNQALFPYEIAPLMLVYSYGYLKMGQTVKVMAVRIAVGILFMATVAFGYWSLMGLA